jgi:1-acyl-sn-glycerol-3-phosphate acyltransferase
MGREVGERQEGRLQFRGPSATQGYYRNEPETCELFDHGWLNTGDLAYTAGGELYLTGRTKDIIIRSGRNIHPHEVEEAVGDIPDIRKGGVAVFGSTDERSGRERIVVLAETEEAAPEKREGLRLTVSRIVTELLDAPPDEIVFSVPDTVPKTPSGKVRRSAVRGLYESGSIGAARRTVRLQLIRLTLAGLPPRIRRGLGLLREAVYAGYWWTALVSTAAMTWTVVIVLPRRAWRWAAIRVFARLFLRITRMPLLVEGAEEIPASGGVIVANHASYLDGLVIAATIPGDLVFVAKEELAGQFFAGRFLRRLGTLFVTRWDPESGLQETQDAERRAQAKERLVFFPEGTFTRMPGLLPFHLGAFVVAAQAAMPVVPMAIHGTRTILRSGQWFPRRGTVHVVIGNPLSPKDSDFSAAIDLRDAARAVILAHCGEPDLAEEQVIFAEPGATPEQLL